MLFLWDNFCWGTIDHFSQHEWASMISEIKFGHLSLWDLKLGSSCYPMLTLTPCIRTIKLLYICLKNILYIPKCVGNYMYVCIYVYTHTHTHQFMHGVKEEDNANKL